LREKREHAKGSSRGKLLRKLRGSVKRYARGEINWQDKKEGGVSTPQFQELGHLHRQFRRAGGWGYF